MDKLQKLARTPVGLTAPAFVILLVVFGIPIAVLLMSSLNLPAFSLAHYAAFFNEQSNVLILLQTIQISAVATAICLALGYPTAYLIVAASKPVRAALVVMVLIPYLTSGLARTYAWIVILGDRGLINSALLQIGLISSPLDLVYNRMAVYIGMVHVMLPVMILPLVSVMQGIDKSLMSAARSMGARPFAAFLRVFVPLSLPGVRSGVLLVFIGCLGFYILPQALGGLKDAMLSNFIAAQLETSFNMASIAASAFVLLGTAAIMLFILGVNLSGTQGQAAKAAQASWRSRLFLVGTLARHWGEFSTPSRSKRWTAQLYRSVGNSGWSKILGIALIALVMFFLLFPGVIVIIMSFSAGAQLEFPPSGLSLRWYHSFFGNEGWRSALGNSLVIGASVAMLSTIVGTLAAYGLSSAPARLRSLLTIVMLTPIMFPAIVVAVACYAGLMKLGLIGTQTGLVLAHSIGSISYVVVIVAATLSNFDRRLEQAAKSMRAGPVQTFTRVTLPLIRPGIIAGAVFAFLHSFDEVVITSLVSGFSMRTLPMKMWENIKNEVDPTIAAVGALLTLLPVIWLIVLYVTGWRSKATAESGRAPAAA